MRFDLEEFEQTASPEAALYVSSRAVLRAFPEVYLNSDTRDGLLFAFRAIQASITALSIFETDVIDAAFSSVRQFQSESHNQFEVGNLRRRNPAHDKLVDAAHFVAMCASFMRDNAETAEAEARQAASRAISYAFEMISSNADLDQLEYFIDKDYYEAFWDDHFSQGSFSKPHITTPLVTSRTNFLPLVELPSVLRSSGIAWGFWSDWLDGVIFGKPLDWDLQREVALIEDAIWEAGLEAVAEEIERIKAEFLAEKSPLAEKLEFNEDTAKFHTVPQPATKPDLLGATLSQVEDALEDVLASASNGLNETSREVRVLKRTTTKYGNDPQRIEMDFTQVHGSVTRQIAVGELPPSEENLALQTALQDGAQGIRATHPDVEENRRILNAQKLKEMDAEQKVMLAEAQPMLVEISEGQMREDFEEDISFILEDRYYPPYQGYETNAAMMEYTETIRTLSRIAGMSMYLHKFPHAVAKIEASTAYKLAGIIATLGALVSLGISLF